ncbi:hypothetical protein FF905_04810 [Bordetella pertussis]|nr:hypothetical protein EHO96_09365 [Bordetella pertussis]AZI28835.1 hypothetical protein EHO76_04360 [Bordetella pertussis]QBZ00679.1 hypothetical protein C3D97_14985 [Bordetella pertussis]QEK24386.1 hypothetical protein CG033_04960 [Bordetella pertussis]QEK27995.1 hypothetical protein FF936_04765 [Bordetella pertussis]
MLDQSLRPLLKSSRADQEQRPPRRACRCRVQWQWDISLFCAPCVAWTSCEDSIGCMHGSSEPDLRNWKSPTSQFTQGARPDEHP